MQPKFALSLLLIFWGSFLTLAWGEGAKDGKAAVVSIPQAVPLPSPMHEILVEQLDFDPTADDSCVSVEGPRKVIFATLPPEDDPDGPTSCALELFKNKIQSFPYGTQLNSDMIQNLKGCLAASNKPKHAVIIGHGDPGLISTGNGPSPGSNQSFDVTDTDIIDNLRALPNVSDILLFGCDTGVGPRGQELLNAIAGQKGNQKGVPVRARNSAVLCTLDESNGRAHQGLYVLSGKYQQWVPSQLGVTVSQPVDEASATIDSNSCLALKGQDQQFKIILSAADLKQKKEKKKISISDFRSETAQRLGLFSEFELLPKDGGDLTKDGFSKLVADDPEVLDSIDFCQVLPQGMVPDRTIVGSFTLTVDGSSRKFYELRGGLAQDSEHAEVYYLMKPHTVEALAKRIHEKWKNKLEQSKQNRLQKTPDAGKAHN